MTRKMLAAGGALVAVAAVLIVWRPLPFVSGATGRSASDPAQRHAEGSKADGRRFDPPLPEGPFDSVRQELTRRATAGDPAAAYHLGRVLAQCHRYKPIADNEFARMAARAIGSLRHILPGGQGEETLLMNAVIEAKPEMDDLCAGTDGVRAKNEADEAARWMAAAAEARDPRAMVDYADVAFAAFPTSVAVIDHAAEVAQRRERARAWLLEARRAGNVEAMLGLAKAYALGTLYPQDRERALGWLLAYRDARGEHRVGPAAIAFTEYQMRKGLDAAAQERAARFARSVAVPGAAR